jgi:hypothetical protein
MLSLKQKIYYWEQIKNMHKSSAMILSTSVPRFSAQAKLGASDDARGDAIKTVAGLKNYCRGENSLTTA